MWEIVLAILILLVALKVLYTIIYLFTNYGG